MRLNIHRPVGLTERNLARRMLRAGGRSPLALVKVPAPAVPEVPCVRPPDQHVLPETGGPVGTKIGGPVGRTGFTLLPMASDVSTATVSAATNAAATIAIAPLDPADTAAVDGVHAMMARARPHDIPEFPLPCRRVFQASLQVPWVSERTVRWIARTGWEVVGYLEISLPIMDNLDNAHVDVLVDVGHRRQGLGRALYQYAVDFARAEGRRRLMAFTPDMPLRDSPAPNPAATAFAAAMGMTNALDDVRRRLDVSTVDQSTLDAALVAAWTRAAGYSLVPWTGRTPEDIIDDIAYLDGRLSIDAPLGDLAWEPDQVDAARIRANDNTREAYGRRSVSTAARHDASGRIVAWTAVIQDPSNVDHAWQGITIVDPDHRGHRLGTIIKIENLRYAVAEFPALRHIDTWNAAVNDHMISINELMGFRKMELWRNWQQDV
jgi:GNAT superfamily N-acetyltransferase